MPSAGDVLLQAIVDAAGKPQNAATRTALRRVNQDARLEIALDY